MKDKKAKKPGLEDFARFVVGSDEGELKRLKAIDTSSCEAVWAFLAGTDGFRDKLKRQRTMDFGVSGRFESKLEAVGLDPAGISGDFFTDLEAVYLPLLAARRDGFRTLFEALRSEHGRGDAILETGTLRLAKNWAGDGQSTFLFDRFVQSQGGLVFSIDANPDSVDSARAVCSSAVACILGDSISTLAGLARQLRPQSVSLLYLDSFDLDRNNPVPSALHHIKELTAAMPLLRPGCLVAIDDFNVPGAKGGKGMYVDEFMRNIGAEVLHESYQKLWRLP